MPEMPQRYYGALDGLRTVCVTLVILQHLKGKSGVINGFPAWLGVDLFFLISGFLITTLLMREESETGKIDLWAFYVRRFFRIVPVYSLVLAFYFLTAAFSRQRWHLMVHYAWYYLTFSGDLLPLLTFNTQSRPLFGATWTLGIEEKFYLIWPVLFFVLLARRRRNFVIPIIFLLIAPLPFYMFRSYFGLLLGCASALFLRHDGFVECKAIISRMPPIIPITVLAIGFYAVAKSSLFVFFFDVTGALFLSSLVSANNWMTTSLSRGPLAWIGRRSYSLYLIHQMTLDIVEHFAHSRSVLMTTSIVLVTLALAALGATLLFHFVEEPARRYGKQLLARRGPPRSSVNPAVALASASPTLQT